MKNTECVIGTQLKLKIHINPLGSLHMSDYDFEAKFYIFPKRFVTINKSEMIKIDSDNYTAIIDTENLGIGRLHMQLIANLPDKDFSDTVRKEIVCVDTGINVIKC